MNNFKSKNGITIDDVRIELKKQKASIARDKAYTCRRWIISVEKHEDFYIRYNPTMEEMLNELKTKGVVNFCKENSAAPDGKNTKIRKQQKIVKKTAKTSRKKTVKKSALINQLQEKRIDLVVKKMQINLTEVERNKIKKELQDIRQQIVDAGGSLNLNSTIVQTDMSAESLKEYKDLGEKKKAEKLRKKKENKNKSVTIK